MSTLRETIPRFKWPIGVLLCTALAIAALTGGHLFYTLDDPYIHLALAKNIQSGWYGINRGEYASPSSSIVWPFLLALFPGPLLEFAPLVLNSLACLASIWIISRIFCVHGEQPLAMLWATLLGLGLNWFGLVFTGMEHSLQVLLCVAVAFLLVRRQFDRRLFVLLAVLPLVRYECLAITLPVAVYLFLEGRRRAALLLLVFAIAALAAFSGFLWSHDLPLLPTSVIAKSPVKGLAGYRTLLLENLRAHSASFVMVALVGASMRGRMRAFVLCVLVPAALVVLFGRVGWFGRYEVFIVAFLLVFLLHEMVHAQFVHGGVWRQTLIVLGISLAFVPLLLCTIQTPLAARNVAQQQEIMARIAVELDEAVAVNDLGLVAFRSQQDVLDLWGLGSLEALNARTSGQKDWIAGMMTRKHVSYAFIYDSWFPDKPKSWIKVAEIQTPHPIICLGGDNVALYSVDNAAAERLTTVLKSPRPTWDTSLVALMAPR